MTPTGIPSPSHVPLAGRTASVWPFSIPFSTQTLVWKQTRSLAAPRNQTGLLPLWRRSKEPLFQAYFPPFFPHFSPVSPLILYLSSTADPVRALAPPLPVLVSLLRVSIRTRGGFIVAAAAPTGSKLPLFNPKPRFGDSINPPQRRAAAKLVYTGSSLPPAPRNGGGWVIFGLFLAPSTSQPLSWWPPPSPPATSVPLGTQKGFEEPKYLREQWNFSASGAFWGRKSRIRTGTAPGGFRLGFEVGMALLGFTSPFPSLWGSRCPTWERVNAESHGKAALLPELPFSSFFSPLFFCILSQNHEVLWPVLGDGEEFWGDSSCFPSVWGGNHMEGREQRHSSDWTGGVGSQTHFL